MIVSETPVPALGALARGWRQDLAAFVIGVTGSVGKTSTKDLIAAMIAPHRSIAASRENYNTEIGLPLEILSAPFGTEVLVLELAMRGFGQIRELAAICEPDVGVITNIGPVHLEQMGSLEGVAEAKAELLDGLQPGGTAVIPSDEPLLEPWLRDDLEIVTFGPAGDVHYEGASLRSGVVPDAPPTSHVVIAQGERVELELPFDSRHNLLNALAALAAARAIGVHPSGKIDVRFSSMRGERVAVGIGAVVINDCYNANPLSMRAALDDLASHQAEGRRVAVLGDMLELGPAEREHHREIGAYAASAGVELLVTVGPRAAAMLDPFDGESHAVLDAGEAAALLPELVHRGRRRAGQGARAASGSRSSPKRCRPPADGRGPDRGDGVPAHVHLPVPEVHRVPAPARVRAAHPRGRAAGAPRQGGHADDGRDHHLHRRLGAVPAADRVLAARDRGVRRRAGVRAARLRGRLDQDRQAPLAGPARAHEAARHDRRSRSGCGWSPRAGPTCPTPSTCGSSTPASTSATSIPSSSTSCWPARPRRST